MPGLRGNICWGHRVFGAFGEYPSLSGELPSSPVHISTNAYYGQHHIVQDRLEACPLNDQSAMEVSEEPEPAAVRTLKRFRNEPVQTQLVKRIRQGDGQNEEDLRFMEHYLKQTHGCDYFSYKQSA